MTGTHGGVLLHAFKGLRRWRRRGKTIAKRRRAIAELDALDDRVLQDIGVNRRSIPELVDAQLRHEAEAGAPDPRPALRPAVLGRDHPPPAIQRSRKLRIQVSSAAS